MKIKAAVLAIALSIGILSFPAQAEMTDYCQYHLFPIFAGGTSKEYVNCFAYDPNTELIVVGGNTTSEDFAPAANDHGYLFAIDLDGNWKWGKFFYNVSYAVSDVSGCQLSSDGSSLTIFGMGNSQPIVMDVNTENGSINKFISMEYWETSDEVVPSYKTYGALYYDTRDGEDFKEYFYMSFIMDLKLQMVRLLNTEPPVVDWSYEFEIYDTENNNIEEKANRQDP